MAKDPAVLLYTSDFLTGTAHLKDDELGFYTRLLANQHQQGPMSLDFIKRTCKGNFAKKWAMIKDKFISDENGNFYNPRMKIETVKRKKTTDAQTDRVNKRWGKNGYPGNTESIQDTGNTFLENENEIEDRRIEKGVTGEKERWHSKPTDQTLPLQDMEINLTIEFMFRLKQKMLTAQQVNEYWQAFKIQYFTGEQYYATRSRCIQHFRDWLKFQKDDGNSKISGSGGKQAGEKPNRIDTLNKLQ